MIHVVTQANRSLYAEALARMHELRRVHFVEERGWNAMTVRDGGEYDEYDDDKMVYLLAIEPDGEISCSMRMRPAEDGSVLGDVFPHLVADDEPPINRPDVWEISRYFATGAVRGRGGAQRRAEIRLASLEVAMARGASRLVGMIDLEMLPPMLNSSGWRARVLGLPAPYPEGVAQAIEVEVCPEAVTEMEETQGLQGPLCLDLDPQVVPAGLPPHEIEALLAILKEGESETALMRIVERIAKLQNHVSEQELLALLQQAQPLPVEGRLH
ncbi:acyl-homoserine-lactone synthase [Phenylobacterium sp.]|uniref:acyl-homoserine-lactone synthase n=1 Tax=Phenylobacterium sp. TaxID=1871053 RepID=UPI0035B180B4